MAERNYRIPSDYSSYSLCRKVKAWDSLKLSSPASLNYDKAIVGGQIIADFIKGDIAEDEIIEACIGGLASEDIGLDQTVEKVAEKTGKDILRYLKSEQRLKRFEDKSRNIINPPSLEFYIGEELFKWAPGALIISDSGFEAVIYKMGKPKVNARTGIKDTLESKGDWFSMYCALKYAQAFMKGMVKAGKVADKTWTCTGSYYYMKKSTDKRGAARDEDFFSGKGGNVVQMTEKCTVASLENDSENDVMFKEYMEKHEIGVEQCSTESCKYCDYRSECQFVKAPEKLAKKEVKASKVKIPPTTAQQAIIDEVADGDSKVVKVVAGAGAGKTFTMKELIRALLKKEVDLAKILMISFTDSGVKELKERVAQVLKEEDIDRDDIQAKTFNGFGFDIVKDRYQDVDLPKKPTILTAEFQMQSIEDLIGDEAIPGVDMEAIKYGSDGSTTPEALVIAQKVFELMALKHLDSSDPDAKDEISYGLSEANLGGKINDAGIAHLIKLYDEYVKGYKADGYLTYSDQEPLMLEIVDKNPGYLDTMGYEYIIVDEFQDSNETQLEILKRLMATKCFKKLVVVGDDAQAIFAFRETTVDIILNLDKYLGIPVKTMTLFDNYRSTPEIIDLANKVIALNENRFEKDLVSKRETGETPTVKGFHSKDAEYEFIRDEIIKRHAEGIPYESQAFIAGTKSELVAMGAKLSEAGIPWVMKNPMNLLENSRVVAALALSDAFYDPETTKNYFDYLTAKYDGHLMDKDVVEVNGLIEVLKTVFLSMEDKPFEEQQSIFHGYLEELRGAEGDDEIYDYFLELLYDNEDFPSELRYTRIFKKYGAKMAKKMDQNYVGVVLTTAHSSKGLEWAVVYNSITAYDSAKFHRSPIRRAAEIEEKRRLLFVSLTRARDVLYVTGQFSIKASKTDNDDSILYNTFLRDVYTILDVDYDPVDHDKERREAEAKERAKEKAKERRAKQKAAKTREMTDEEKAMYNKLVSGSCQTSLF